MVKLGYISMTLSQFKLKIKMIQTFALELFQLVMLLDLVKLVMTFLVQFEMTRK